MSEMIFMGLLYGATGLAVVVLISVGQFACARHNERMEAEARAAKGRPDYAGLRSSIERAAGQQ